jgi:hypothetical protein
MNELTDGTRIFCPVMPTTFSIHDFAAARMQVADGRLLAFARACFVRHDRKMGGINDPAKDNCRHRACASAPSDVVLRAWVDKAQPREASA